jgi:quinoprotein glucose dehydrogenase
MGMTRLKQLSGIGVIISVVLIATVVGTTQERAPRGEWRYFGADHAFTRYSPLDQINRDNVKNLRIVWRRPAVREALTKAFPQMRVNNYLRATPIMVDGILYTQDAHGFLTAIDGETGRTIWQQEPLAATQEEATGAPTRGVDYWRGAGNDKRIFAIRGEYLYALNAEDGKPSPGFGENGRSSLHFDENQPLAGRFGSSTGPLVVNDVVIVTGTTAGAGDGGNKKEAAPENVRGFDARTGKLLWTFNVVPKPGEFGNDTWGNDSWKIAGDLGAWNMMTADEELGYVYIPLTAPTTSWYGGWRPGDNLFSNSLVALDVKTGKRVWHFQMVHHDLWEYDNVGAATLGDITVDGRRIKTVMQPNKSGFLFVLDRTNGKPVWPIEERPVPPSRVPGEHASPTQPFPTKPAAFDRQGISDADLIDYTPELKARAREAVKDYELGPLFTPPSLITDQPGTKKGTLKLPGDWGSANWNTGAFDPETGMYYAVSTILPGPPAPSLKQQTAADATLGYALVFSTQPQQPGGGGQPGQPPAAGGQPGQGGQGQPPPQPQGLVGLNIDGLPVIKGPYGRITAINMNTGDHAWMVPNGDGPRNHPLLKGLNLPPLGTPSRPAPMVTKTLLFLGEGTNTTGGTPRVDWGWGKKFRAYDKATGRVIHEMELPSGTTGGPMTYMLGGKQYIVVAIGALDHPAEYIALALP